jgi:PAS domain S-box-containing protein
MRDASGQPLASIGIVRDITDHKQSEQKLIESEGKYRSQSNPMRLMCDCVPDIGYPHYGCRNAAAVRRVRQCSRKFLFLDMHKVPFIDQNGKMIGTVGSARDVTRAKEMEQRLNQSEAFMRAITDSVRDGILRMDQNGLISFWNPAAERIFGYPGEEAVGKNLHRLIAPQQYQEAHQAAFAGFQQTGQGYAIDATIELGARHKDGHEITVELSLSRLRIHDGWHTIGIIRDVTDRKRDETNKARVEAQNMQLLKAESLGRMAGAIAHQFNNNFHVVMGNLEIAMDGLSLGVNPKESLVSAM